MKAPGRGRDGFVLVEAIVALTILAVVLLPVAGMSYQVASRSVRSTVEMHRAGVMTREAGRLTVLPFDLLPSAGGCDSVMAPPFPHRSCVVVTDLGTDDRRVTVVVEPTLPIVQADTWIVRRTKAPVANPVSP